jgi:hypothetical protein
MVELSAGRIVVILTIGAVTPFLWLATMSLWSLYVYMPALNWLWAVLALKGPWLALTSNLLHSIVVAAALAVALQVVTRRAWVRASALFCAAFLIASLVSIAASDKMTHQDLLGIAFYFVNAAPLLACVAGFLGLLARIPTAHEA